MTVLQGSIEVGIVTIGNDESNLILNFEIDDDNDWHY